MPVLRKGEAVSKRNGVKLGRGRCQNCRRDYRLVEFGRIEVHPHPSCFVISDSGDRIPQCPGSFRPPQEHCDKIAIASRNKRTAFVDQVRDEARVVLDTLIERPERVDLDFPGRMHALMKAALIAFRLQYPGAQAFSPWRWLNAKRGQGSRWRSRTGDLWCWFCGLPLATQIPAGHLRALRGLLALDRAKLIEIETKQGGISRALREHCEPCGLIRLAGMQPFGPPGIRTASTAAVFVPENNLYQDDEP